MPNFVVSPESSAYIDANFRYIQFIYIAPLAEQSPPPFAQPSFDDLGDSD